MDSSGTWSLGFDSATARLLCVARRGGLLGPIRLGLGLRFCKARSFRRKVAGPRWGHRMFQRSSSGFLSCSYFTGFRVQDEVRVRRLLSCFGVSFGLGLGNPVGLLTQSILLCCEAAGATKACAPRPEAVLRRGSRLEQRERERGTGLIRRSVPVGAFCKKDLKVYTMQLDPQVKQDSSSKPIETS